MRPSLALTAVVLALTVGCKKEEPEPYVLPPQPTYDSDTGVFVPPPKVFTEVRLIAFVAWDPVEGQTVPYSYQGDSRDSRLEIRLYDGPGPQTEFCTVGIPFNGLEIAPDAKAEGFAWGVDIPAGSAYWESCSYEGYDIDAFPEGAGIDVWGGADYHLRFYSGMTQDLIDWLTPDNPTSDFEINHYTGGDFWTDSAGISTDADNNYWYGYEPDENWDVDVDASTPLDQRYSMLDPNGDMVRGYFVFDQRVFWEF